MLWNSEFPGFIGFVVAPISATVLGSKNNFILFSPTAFSIILTGTAGEYQTLEREGSRAQYRLIESLILCKDQPPAIIIFGVIIMDQKNKSLSLIDGAIDSATVVLLRNRDNGSFEVFLMRRHKKQSFMGGAYVFPGGRLDKADCDPGLAEVCRGHARPERDELQEPELAEDVARGLMLCAVRELFEEAGVLLAYDRSGALVDLSDEAARSRFDQHRRDLHDGALSLADLAGREGITYALDRLTPWSRWITPEIEKKRFNTRFLLALLPEGQEPAHDRVELTDSIWLGPRQALDRHRADSLLLMPPTIKTLLEIKDSPGTAELFHAAAAKKILPILPQGFITEGGFGVRLPHDPEYAIAGFKQPPRPGEVSRLCCRSGKWSY
jgi:8-oxo-dGTP pyrophosphatase MutT (NUDIX family)